MVQQGDTEQWNVVVTTITALIEYKKTRRKWERKRVFYATGTVTFCRSARHSVYNVGHGNRIASPKFWFKVVLTFRRSRTGERARRLCNSQHESVNWGISILQEANVEVEVFTSRCRRNPERICDVIKVHFPAQIFPGLSTIQSRHILKKY